MHGPMNIKVPLHVLSLKCSSSGGHPVYMQRMLMSLSTRVRGGLSVHTLKLCARQATTNSRRE